MPRFFFLTSTMLLATVVFASCTGSRERAFFQAAHEIESQIAFEWGAVVDVVGVSPNRDMSFMEWEGGRDYIRWRLLNIERFAELGLRLRPPASVSKDWTIRWTAGLDAFTTQGGFAFKGLRENDSEMVSKALGLCEAGWSELAQREPGSMPVTTATYR